MYLWQSAQWPHFQYDPQAVQPALVSARLAQGRMLGMASSLQLVDLGELQLTGWAQEAVATAQIEGEVLQLNSVRASAARRLGLQDAPNPPRDARTEATLDVLQAAVGQWQRPLKDEDLWAWQAALFPNGRSGVARVVTGAYRTHAEPMQIVTPRLGKPDLVHYQAPDSAAVPTQMAQLLAWFNHGAPISDAASALDGLVRSAIAHLWFETIHPFEDGNGRVGRALAELALAQDMRSSQRLFSLSQQLWLDRAGYYAQLQAATGQAHVDITPWVLWFLGRIEKACQSAELHMQTALARGRYWAQAQAAHPHISSAQCKALARLLEAEPAGFAGGMSTEKYVHLTGTSRATAYRELTQLVELGLLTRSGAGRGTRYQLVV
jgi:Fic family protein